MMADDIDDLLDEVETKFCTKDKKKKASVSRKSTTDDVIDELLDDIKDDIAPLSETDYPVNNGMIQNRPESSRKCFPIYVGNTSLALGRSNSMNKKGCDKLRCTACDFKVITFDNFEWDPETDYLFLRNNVPDFHRLKSNLLPKKGCRAYCCQCCHKSVNEFQQLKDPKIKWVCGKH